MDVFWDSLTHGVAMAAEPSFLGIMIIATAWGIVSGAMPGLSASLAVGVAIPFTFSLTPEEAVAALLAILVGVNYGNSLPAVVLGVPGTPAALLTAQEGYQLHQRGQGDTALGVTYVASVTGQFFSIIFFVAFVVPLSQIAYLFLAPEQFAMTVLAMSAVVGLAGRSMLKGLLAAAVGIALAMVGRDPVNSVPRFTFGVHEIRDGFQVVIVVIGLLAVSELIRSSRQVFSWDAVYDGSRGIRFPDLRVIKETAPAITTGTVVGTVIGILPGASADAAAYIAYQQAKARSKKPKQFGKGSLEGVGANEAAQNACQAGDLIPTIAVGIPGGTTMVLILAAITMHGLIPGPLLLEETPTLLHACVAGLLVSTVILAVIGWPLAKGAFRVATLDRSIVLACTLVLVVVGVFTLNRSMFDVGVAVAFGGIGYVMLRFGYPLAALALGLILGGKMESSLRQGILLSDGSLVDMVTRPVTLVILILAAVALVYGVYSEVRARSRGRAEMDDTDLVTDRPPPE